MMKWKSTFDLKHSLETNLKVTSMKHLQQTNQTTQLETRKKALIEIGRFATSQDDNAILKAQLEPPIKAYDYAKPESKKLIIAAFVEWAHLVGAKEANTADENIINAKFIIANFGDMTITEIRQAAHWSVIGKLELDATCYGKLSPIYMAKILNAYLNLRDKKIGVMRVKLSEHKQVQEHNAKFNKPLEERLAEMRGFLIKHLTLMKTKREGDVGGQLIWKFMTRAKLVNDTFSPEAQQYAREQLKNMKSDLKYRQSIKGISQVKVMDSEESYVQRCMQDFTIWHKLETIKDIKAMVSGQPDEVIIPKEQHKSK